MLGFELGGGGCGGAVAHFGVVVDEGPGGLGDCGGGGEGFRGDSMICGGVGRGCGCCYLFGLRRGGC